MITVEIDPRDLAELKRDLTALEPKNLLRDEQAPLAKSIIEEAGKYPSPGASPRTGNLGRSWAYALRGADTEITNAAVYAGYVVGSDQTNAAAAAGWKRVVEVAEAEADKLLKRLGEKADKLWR